MKQDLIRLGVAVLVGLGLSPAFTSWGEDADLKKEADQAVDVFKKKDSSLQKFFDESAGYAVFPSVGRGGLIFGGQHGKGVFYEKRKAVGDVTLTEINFGAQIGGASYYELIFFEAASNIQDLKENKTRLSAQVNAIAAGDGVAKTAKYDQGIVVFTLPRSGLMAQATVGGQKLTYKDHPKWD
jgi:lipid-binding SYLF domain-containing protein